ncbi:MAG: DUF5688 family protein [Lachnospiraceae bacterium]|nr:DUF5688 family protein [Lachnospiraceae bacterium]
MSYEEFIEEVKGHILDYLPAEARENATVVVDVFKKNNAVNLTGLVIRYPETNISPTIYLDHYYTAYLNAGKDLEEIMLDIAETYQTYRLDHSIDTERIFNPDYLKDHLYFTVVGQTANAEMLKHMPHESLHDMALIYKIDTTEIVGDASSITVTDKTLDVMQMDVCEMQEIASQNTPVLKPYTLRTLTDVIREMYINDLQNGGMSLADGLEEAVDALLNSQSVPPMYYLGNQEGMYGAAAMYYPGVLDEVAKTIGGSFYILPSSVHEVLIVPKSIGMPYEELIHLVRDINDSVVINDTEILTDNVYSYNSRTREFLTAAEAAERDLCARDIQNAGFKPTKQLVANLSQLTHLTGKHHTLEDISDLQRNAKRMVYHTNPEANQYISRIIQECAGQELARLQQAQEVATAAVAAVPEA